MCRKLWKTYQIKVIYATKPQRAWLRAVCWFHSSFCSRRHYLYVLKRLRNKKHFYLFISHFDEMFADRWKIYGHHIDTCGMFRDFLNANNENLKINDWTLINRYMNTTQFNLVATPRGSTSPCCNHNHQCSHINT